MKLLHCAQTTLMALAVLSAAPSVFSEVPLPGRDAPQGVPSLDGESPRTLLRPAGPAEAWDFASGLPPGGKLRKAAVRDVSGLHATDAASGLVPAGFMLDALRTPKGAFLFEATFTAGTNQVAEGLLWDDMAVNYSPKWTNRGFQLMFRVRGGVWEPVFYGGFSNTTCHVSGPRVKLAPGERGEIAFYFGADRRLAWEFNGQRRASLLDCGGPLAPSVRIRPVLGDREVSLHHAFPGCIRHVAITPGRTDPWAVEISGRRAYVRGETNAVLDLAVQNLSGGELKDVLVRTEQFSRTSCVATRTRACPRLGAGARFPFALPVETRLAPGRHPLRVTVSGRDAAGRSVACSRVYGLGIGPRATENLTALMWGFDAPPQVLADFGFTHGLRYGLAGDAGRAALDEALVAGVGLTRSMRVEYPDGAKEEDFWRQDRRGSPRIRGKKGKGNPEVSNPVLLETALPQVEKDLAALGDHPAYKGVLPCSEIRDGTFPSFRTEAARYKAETGREVPPEVEGRTLNEKVARTRYPDGVVPDDDPVLAYYRWFWSGGDGWPSYTGGIAAAYRKRRPRDDFFVFWDPAVRCPPRWGSGGAVDLINQWVYAVPEPMSVAGPCEEMFAMAAGRPGQQVSIMTQLICYRSQIAPTNKVVSPAPAWLARRPRADFPTIPPDSLQEATWAMIAKPVQAIMYHGWGTIYETGVDHGYVYTNPESAQRLRTLLKDVVAPLGPTLKRLGRAPSAVAVLESFTTCAMGGPASWGWKAPAITFLQRARLDPRVVYEETVLRDGLDDVQVLYAPQCRYLTPALIARIRAFQARGGILVADDELVAALKPDVRVPVVSFDRPPASDHTEDVDVMEARRQGDVATRTATLRAKAKMVAQAAQLRADLASRYAPATDSSSPELVTFARRWKDVDYVFALNDHRTFGDYVGQWGLTMEKGLPFEGCVTQADPANEVKAVYELSRGGACPHAREGGRVKVPLQYGTNDGRLLLFAKQRIAALDASAAKSVARGGAFEATLRVLDEAGRPVAALLPVEIRVTDAAGRPLDGTGFACAVDGVCRMTVQTNVDDAPGDYRVFFRDRASGLTAERRVEVHERGAGVLAR